MEGAIAFDTSTDPGRPSTPVKPLKSLLPHHHRTASTGFSNTLLSSYLPAGRARRVHSVRPRVLRRRLPLLLRGSRSRHPPPLSISLLLVRSTPSDRLGVTVFRCVTWWGLCADPRGFFEFRPGTARISVGSGWITSPWGRNRPSWCVVR
jgi:hypothetical protein